MADINDIFLLDVKPSVKMEGIPQNLAKAVESLLLANGISKEDITYIKKNRE